jgi:hypothetical protein
VPANFSVGRTKCQSCSDRLSEHAAQHAATVAVEGEAVRKRTTGHGLASLQARLQRLAVGGSLVQEHVLETHARLGLVELQVLGVEVDEFLVGGVGQGSGDLEAHFLDEATPHGAAPQVQSAGDGLPQQQLVDDVIALEACNLACVRCPAGDGREVRDQRGAGGGRGLHRRRTACLEGRVQGEQQAASQQEHEERFTQQPCRPLRRPRRHFARVAHVRRQCCVLRPVP